MAESVLPSTIDRTFFGLLESCDFDKIIECSLSQLKCALPLLTRCSLCSLADIDAHLQRKRQSLTQVLLSFSEVNNLIACLSADFNEIAFDCHSQLALRKKQCDAGDSVSMNYSDDVIANFESYSIAQQFKIIITEVKWLISLTSEKTADGKFSGIIPAPILQLSLFRDWITKLICIALHELPSLFPLCDVIEALLYLNNPLDMILSLIINSPWSAAEVCCNLIKSSHLDHPDSVTQVRIDIIRHICRLSPTAISQATKTCVAYNKLPQVLAYLYISEDEGGSASINKLSEFIFTHRRLAKSLLVTKNQTSPEDSELLAMIRQTIDRELDALVRESVFTSSTFYRLTTLIRLCSCLRELNNYKFTESELEKMFNIFPQLPLGTEKEMQLTMLALCLVIASIHQMSAYSQELSTWLRNLARNDTLYTQSNDTSIGQFLLLIAIHYHGNQLSTISEMVASYLNIKPSAVKLSNTILKQIITYEIFTEPVISQRTILLSVTENLNANMKGYLPIHCVCQLLKSRAFSKHNVSISEWITQQLANVALPLHPMVQQMITLYVATTTPQQHNMRSANPQLDEQRIRDQFEKSTDKHLASQLVFLYYILSHQEAVYTEPALASKKRPFKPYSSELMSSIPTKLLMVKAYEHRYQCSSLYASLVKLLYTNMPQICKADMWLFDTSTHQKSNLLVKLFSPHLSGESGMDSIYKQYIKLRLASESLSADTLPVLLDSIKLVQSSPADCIPRHMTLTMAQTWLAYSRIAPERLYLETVKVLRSQHGSLKEDQLVTDPLLVLQCLPTCRQPDLLVILLHLIGVYSRASNRYFTLHWQNKQPHGTVALTEAQEICYSLLSAQDSATIQIMLEHCLPAVPANESILCDQRELQTLICSEVHKIIIDNPYQAKLVSFQGYHSKLIPIAIAGIPSMHICLDYVPELLAQPDIAKQMFAVRLTASLCEQYGVHKTFTMAKLCISTVVTLIGVLPARSVISNIIPILPSINSMCQHMPVLYEDWLRLLAIFLPIFATYKDELEEMKQKPWSYSLTNS